jgi:predicted nucleotidyltransferase component of viral defense system
MDRLRFKGGTCLRKCYFGDYRFSEDLDFTATLYLDADRLRQWVIQAARWSSERDGPNFEARAPRMEILRDEYGSETFQVRVYYQGPLQWGGNPRAIRLDVTRDEIITYPPEKRGLLHPYSDVQALGSPTLICYALVEIFSEKIRAIGGQRRFAMSRDLYDIYQLLQAGLSVEAVTPSLHTKFEARSIDLAALNVPRFVARHAEFEADWHRRLNYLVRNVDAVDFDEAWQTAVDVLQQVKGLQNL